MNPWFNWKFVSERAIATGLAVTLLANVPALYAQSDPLPQPQTTSKDASQSPQSSGQRDQTLPDSPSAVLAQAQQNDSPAPSPTVQERPQLATPAQETSNPASAVQQNTAQAQDQNNTPNSNSQQNSQNQKSPSKTREPLGTAAAEAIPTTGVAASRPAGAALAPAKQRRVRSILIKVGAIAGAGAAVGIAFALSKGSPSTPPGSR